MLNQLVIRSLEERVVPVRTSSATKLDKHRSALVQRQWNSVIRLLLYEDAQLHHTRRCATELGAFHLAEDWARQRRKRLAGIFPSESTCALN